MKLEQRLLDLATALHDLLCHWNHTDGCSWHYENGLDKWDTGYAHKQYLKQATEIAKWFDSPQQVTVVVKRIKESMSL